MAGRTLQTIYAQHIAAKPEYVPPPGASPTQAVVPTARGVIPAVALMAFQDTDDALANLVPAVLAYFDYELGQQLQCIRL